jgi:hypothetical protein
MLTSTFVHISGVGPHTERRIWERGLHSWSAFLADPAAAGLPARKTARIVEATAASLERLRRHDHAYFSAALPRREHWRAYPEFGHRIAYLDIETTSLEGDDVTLIGVYDGSDVRVYMKGVGLDRFVDDIASYSLLVTYYGACFDLPFLRRRFLGLQFDQLHIDLCPALRRLGLAGGLKRVETLVGIRRSAETAGLDGWDAVRLWREWECGSSEALDLLKRYHREDVTHLKTLLEHAYPRLCALAGIPNRQAAMGRSPAAATTGPGKGQ